MHPLLQPLSVTCVFNDTVHSSPGHNSFLHPLGQFGERREVSVLSSLT